MNRIVCAVNGSEGSSPDEIDLMQEMIDGSVSYFGSVQSMMDDGDDFSDCVVFVLEIVDIGTVKNNPKFISAKPVVKSVTKTKK